MRPGTTVGGRYLLIRDLTRKRTGGVWLARDRKESRDVVLRRLHSPDGISDVLDRLQSEARAEGPHMVAWYDLYVPGAGEPGGDGGNTAWLVMEFVADGSLEGAPRLASGHAARVGAQLATVLAALHGAGLVHGDVRPGNVFVTSEGLAQLAHFGTACRAGETELGTRKDADDATSAHVAPEFIAGRPEPASDVFSLGATLHYLVTGRPPHRGAGVRTGSHAVRWRAKRGGLGSVLPAMLDPVPEKRPTVAEARRQLEELAGLREPSSAPIAGWVTGTGPVPDSGGSPDRGRSAPSGRWMRLLGGLLRSRALVAGVGAAVAVAAVAVVIARFLLDEEPDPVSVIGKHITADPCAVLDPDTLGRFGEAHLVRDYGNFDRCDVLVETGEGDPVDVEAYFDLTDVSEPAERKKTVKNVTVLDAKGDSGECVKRLLPATDPDVVVSIVAQQDTGTAPLCEMADVATDKAVGELDKGRPLPRRSPGPPNSLIHRKACALLTSHALEALPGVDAKDAHHHFGDWDCEWRSTPGGPWVEVRFDRGPSPTAEDGALTRIAGRSAVVEPDVEDEDTCRIRVKHRSYTDPDGSPAVETINVTVGGDLSPKRLRQLATRLATATVGEVAAG